MPNYVYRGIDCPHEFEVYQSFSDDPLTECSECGKPVRRVFQPTGLVFKGSGWYINDSRKSGSDTGGSKPDSKSTTTTAADTSGSDSKTPATTSKSPEPVAAATSSGKKD